MAISQEQDMADQSKQVCGNDLQRLADGYISAIRQRAQIGGKVDSARDSLVAAERELRQADAKLKDAQLAYLNFARRAAGFGEAAQLCAFYDLALAGRNDSDLSVETTAPA